jgi:hypothetical protein
MKPNEQASSAYQDRTIRGIGLVRAAREAVAALAAHPESSVQMKASEAMKDAPMVAPRVKQSRGGPGGAIACFRVKGLSVVVAPNAEEDSEKALGMALLFAQAWAGVENTSTIIARQELEIQRLRAMLVTKDGGTK